jgi:hypothetical protein
MLAGHADPCLSRRAVTIGLVVVGVHVACAGSYKCAPRAYSTEAGMSDSFAAIVRAVFGRYVSATKIEARV